ncbi:hypothetical protein D621_17765 [beta proteobacterium AAP51]|nr:hypothetical protein D621_17765 [beta proteobacterium AAP51]
MQVNPRNFWPDGSLKFAILSGNADLQAGVSRAVNLRRGSSGPGGAALNLTGLKSTGITAQVACGGFGTVNWAGNDWDTPFQTWATGPLMSSWVYRKPVGSDAHLVAWLEVRLFTNGQVEVLPWVENGYVNVAGPSNKNATYTFTLGGTQRFSAAIDLKHHQRTPLISGTALSYWLANDPGVNLRHDVLYLQTSELVPSYRASVPSNAVAVTRLPATFTPLQQGSFIYGNDNMQSGGYQEPIGLLPEHDVLYLTANGGTEYAAVVRNGYSAGRYGIHYRDEATNRMLRFSQTPSRNIGDSQGFRDNGNGPPTPTPTGGNPPIWDVSHSPSVGYLAYLLTGRFYFMEEAQFAACTNFLGHSRDSWGRNGTQGLVQTAVGAWQTRAMGWQWRTLVQALTVTPDDDTTTRTEFQASIENSINALHATYVAQANNPYGMVLPGEVGDNGTLNDIKVWQQDFVTGAFGYSLALDMPISAAAKTKLAEFFRWKARSVIFRLGPAGDFWYVNANRYSLKFGGAAYGASAFLTGSGQWPSSPSVIYANTIASIDSGNFLSTTEGQLAQEFDANAAARGQWGTLQMAIAYAVRHGVSGALEGYNRMISASNWNTMLVNNWSNTSPVMSVAPANVATPAWLAAAAPAVNQWIEIPNTSAGWVAVNAWMGWAVRGTELWSLCSGGHNDGSDNSVVMCDIGADAPSVVERNAASAVSDRVPNVSYFRDGKPNSRHIYHHNVWVPQRGRFFMVGMRAPWSDGASDGRKMDAFNPFTNTWDPAGTWNDITNFRFGACVDPVTGNVWMTSGGKWTQATQAFTTPGANSAVRWPMAFDTLRNRRFGLNWGDGQGFNTGVNADVIDEATNTLTRVTFNPSAALTQFQADEPSYAGMDYDAANDRFLFYAGSRFRSGVPQEDVPNRIYVITPNDGFTWDMSLLPMASNTATPPGPPTNGSGINGRFKYIAALRGFVMLPRQGANLYFLRVV